jgi:mRNA-degrading endonuclease RelE of RelBE toxin-antitoxin system
VDAHVELAPAAERDLKRLGPGPDRKALVDALTVGLTAIPPPDNLDIKALKGALPWLRLRVGDYRILYRPLTPFEVKTLVDNRALQTEVKRLREQRGRVNMTEMFPAVVRRQQQYPEAGFLIARIVHRRDLDRAVRTLPL